MTVTISRLYNTYPDAQAAINRLEAAGVKHGDISVLASNADGWYKAGETGKPGTFPDRDLDGKDDRAEAAGAGAGIGAVTGGALGALTGLGLMAIPGVGPIVAAGWLVATLTGAAAGAATGGVVGALTQMGVSSEEADVYAEGLRRGGAVVSARVRRCRCGPPADVFWIVRRSGLPTEPPCIGSPDGRSSTRPRSPTRPIKS